VVCSKCGAENRDEARFCDACGALLAATAVQEHRKHVTVLFCDVSGSTALGERLDEAIERGLRAVEVIDSTDYAEQRVEARLALGEALLGAGRRAEAEVVLGEAIESARAKGSTVLQDAARALLDRNS